MHVEPLPTAAADAADAAAGVGRDDRRVTPFVTHVATAAIAVATLAAQWNIDGNRRIDYRIYSRAVAAIGSVGLYGYGSGILRFTYPPAAASIVWPFSLLDESIGSRLWLALTVVAFLGAYGVAATHLRGTRTITPAHALLGAAVALWFAPAVSTMRLGQINGFVAALLCIDIVAFARSRAWAGVGIGLAAAVKVTPLAVIPVVWAGTRRGHSRLAARNAIGAFVAITAIGALVAPESTWQFVRRLSGRAAVPAGVPSVDLRAGLRSIIAAQRAADVAWIVASLALTAAALRTARRLAHAPGPTDGVGLVTVGMCLSTTISPFSSVHHLTFATVAVALWAARSAGVADRVVAGFGALVLLDPTGGDLTAMRWAMLALCIVTVVALPAPTDFVAAGAIREDRETTARRAPRCPI
jgi:alpha-1,2-mannosyltransferase